jgi:hypothetical protein
MTSNTDIMHGAFLRIYDVVNIFNIPYHHVKLYKDNLIIDITEKIKKKSILPIGLKKSSYLHNNHIYQFHIKDTNKYYIITTTIFNIFTNNIILPKESIQLPRKLLTPVYDIYVNGNLLSVDDKIYYKNHHSANNLFHVFNFNNVELKDIIIYDNITIIRTIDTNFNNMNIGNIQQYM